jgi:cytochrome c55X
MTRNRWASLGMGLLFSLPLMVQAGPSGARQLELRHLLIQDCGSCHGMTLKGGLGPALLPANLEGKPDGLLVNTILFGRAGTPMPPWEPMLTEAEAVWLVEQLRKGVTHE